MNCNLCSSPSEAISPCFESVQKKTKSLPQCRASLRTSDFFKKDKVQVVNHDVRKVEISSNFVPGQLERSDTRHRLVVPSRKLDFVRTLLIDNYDSYTYNIYQELSVVNGEPPVVVRNDEWTWEDVLYYIYEERAFDNIVISPGPGSPTCPADIGICLKLLVECKDIPILGVCLGHQALGYVHGAKVVHAFEPVHGRLSEIQHTGGRLFNDIPSGRNSGFKVVRYHSLVIDAESLPNELVPIAWTSSSDTLPFLGNEKSDVTLEACESLFNLQPSVNSFSIKLKNGSSWPSSFGENARASKVLMGIMHSRRPHYGLQFHPESVATCHGRQIFKNFREITEDYWGNLRSSISERKDHYAACMQVPDGRQLLKDFSKSKQNIRSRQTSHFRLGSMVSLSHPSSGDKHLKLKWRKLEHLACQIGGAKQIFHELFRDNKAENTFWLDSSSTEKKRARFSFMGGKGGSLWKQVTFRLSDQSDMTSNGRGYLSVEDAQGSTTNTFLEDGFFHFLNKELQSFIYEEKEYEGLPFDFYGGYIGYLGYGLKVECGMPFNRHKADTPDACFFFSDNLVVIDHLCDDIYILSIHDGNLTESLWLDDVEQKLLRLKPSMPTDIPTSGVARNASIEAGFLSEKSREGYIEDVEKCQQFIKDGESYELCLTTQMRKKLGHIDPLGLYLSLREKNPAPYAAWLNFSKENLSICCSSPERFLRLDRDGILEAKPIKGTIARGATVKEDERLKLQLQYSLFKLRRAGLVSKLEYVRDELKPNMSPPSLSWLSFLTAHLREKDQAENLMIVDLLRNDLGRVCEPGSVHVPHLMEVESYATVHTMVSTICGKKQPNISAVDCVRAAFPGGSMTGAPKLRSMELLDSIESCSRGIYSGCIGFFSYNQLFDLNIVIRTVVIHEGEASVGAGGAIVALSNPEDEYKEMLLKTRAPVKAVMEYERNSLLEQ